MSRESGALSRTYRFHPLERRGLVAGLGPVQVATLAAGLVGALLALSALPSLGGLAVGALLLAGSGALACWPVAGRAPVGWAPVLLGRLLRPGRRVGHPRPATAPAALQLVALPSGPADAELAAVLDRRAGTWAAVVPLAGRSLTLLDPDDQDQRLATWRAVLASCARPGSPVRRVQWIERAGAADPAPLTRWIDERAHPGAHPAAQSSYRRLVAATGSGGDTHEVLLVVAVDPGRGARSARRGSSRRGRAGDVLRRELRIVEGQLRAADCRIGPPLGPAELAGAIRAGLAPDPGRPAQASHPWPMATEEHWGRVRIDGCWQVTYWISEWPRVEVGPDFLTPLLLTGGDRTVAVTMAPVPTARAVREVEAARTADAADEELRRRAGFLATARHRRSAEGVAQREAELADGHAELRFSGYVTVSAGTEEELDRRCAEVEHAAQQGHLELRRLYGQQLEARTWTLPLARGVA